MPRIYWSKLGCSGVRSKCQERASSFLTMSNTLDSNRGRGFTPAEDLLLSRAWVRASAEGTDQDATDLWDNVTEAFNAAASRLAHFGSIAPRSIDSRNRTAQSVRCRWTLVQRVAQKYIAARKTALSTIPSWTNPSEEEIREATMFAYQSLHRARTTTETHVWRLESGFWTRACTSHLFLSLALHLLEK
jgi:hypothetical protein